MGLDLIELKGANVVRIESGAGLQLKAGATASLEAAVGLALKGSLVSINGPSCAPAARLGDRVIVTGGSLGHIDEGSTTVCIG